MKHFLKLGDVSAQEMQDIFELADQLKYEKKHGIAHPRLAGKTLGMIFQKSSTRTRVSFEAGMYQLGGSALHLSSRDLQIGRGEPVQDTARVLSRYLDGIMIRTFAQKEVEDLAAYGSIPVVNGLTDYAHPCQAMEPEVADWAKANGDFTIVRDPAEAVDGADAVYTDVWASMGQEGEAEKRMQAFKNYQVNETNMRFAKPDAMVLHCLPAHRGEEITEETFEKHAGEIFDQAENRLHVQKAILVKLMA